MASLVEQLAQQLANRPGVDYGMAAVRRSGPMGGMYQIDRERRTGTGPLSPEDMAIADRYAEGQNYRARYGVLAPLLAAMGVTGYEGIVKPAMEAVPAIGRLAPEGFRPGEATSKAGGDDALLRALAMVYGSLDQPPRR